MKKVIVVTGAPADSAGWPPMNDPGPETCEKQEQIGYSRAVLMEE
jgi:hypothetical protein